MLKFRFRVHSSGWKDGGYENANFAPTEERVHAIIKHWNEEADKRNARFVEVGEDTDHLHFSIVNNILQMLAMGYHVYKSDAED